MDEKTRKGLSKVICYGICKCKHFGVGCLVDLNTNECLEIQKIEQAFRDAGWLSCQEVMVKLPDVGELSNMLRIVGNEGGYGYRAEKLFELLQKQLRIGNLETRSCVNKKGEGKDVA